ADERGDGELWYGHADMNTGKRTATTFGALDAFFPAVLALSGDIERAKRLQASAFRMWTLNGVEPEVLNYRTMQVEYAGYPLRPEIVESTYYLYHFTRDPAYLRMGETMFGDFVKFCKTEEAYAGLKSVVTKEKSDSMQSFLFAETFKYSYLLFAPPKTLRFEKVVFNTEGRSVERRPVGRLEGGDLVLVDERAPDLVEPLEQVRAREVVDLEPERLAGRARDRARLEIDGHPGAALAVDLVHQPADELLGKLDRQEPDLHAVGLEDVRERRADQHVEAVLLERPRRVLARRAAAEVAPGDED
ncbi:MAG: hypothetical protein DMF66_15880, partial [Acidobacteria bacterium]